MVVQKFTVCVPRVTIIWPPIPTGITITWVLMVRSISISFVRFTTVTIIHIFPLMRVLSSRSWSPGICMLAQVFMVHVSTTWCITGVIGECGRAVSMSAQVTMKVSSVVRLTGVIIVCPTRVNTARFWCIKVRNDGARTNILRWGTW